METQFGNSKLDTSKLVRYPLPDKQPRSEKSVKRAKRFWSVITMISLFAGGLWGIFTLGVQAALWVLSWVFGLYTGGPLFDPFVPWLLSILVTLAFVLLLFIASAKEDLISDELALYIDVPQGKIVKKITRGGAYEGPDLRWIVVIEGYNALNMIRTQEHTIDAGDWLENPAFAVDTYHDFRKE